MTSAITVNGLAAQSRAGQVDLSWQVNDPYQSGPLALQTVEVFAAPVNDFNAANAVGTGQAGFIHSGLQPGQVSYYWIRARDNSNDTGELFPVDHAGGVLGVEGTDFLVGANGYWKHANGLIEQWGVGNLGDGDTVTFRIAFPSELFGINYNSYLIGGSSARTFISASASTLTGFTVAIQDINGNPAGTEVFWRALGK